MCDAKKSLSYRKSLPERTKDRNRYVLIMRVVIAEDVVDHVFFRDAIDAHHNELLNVIAAQQLSGGAVCDTAEHFAQLLQRYDLKSIGVKSVQVRARPPAPNARNPNRIFQAGDGFGFLLF